MLKLFRLGLYIITQFKICKNGCCDIIKILRQFLFHYYLSLGNI